MCQFAFIIYFKHQADLRHSATVTAWTNPVVLVSFSI